MDENIDLPPLPDFIGPYKILEKIASGGMGDVFLTQDPFCSRTLALKKIREDKIDQPTLKARFLKEAKIAAQLSHPNIIPIYQIHNEEGILYYTMPLVKGSTLKEILRLSKEKEKEGLSDTSLGASIPSLMRIFWSVCQAVAYAHSKKFLHRDLKPENIIIGPYGEVLILDWGLADALSDQEEEGSIPLERDQEEEDPNLTRPGKLAGTLRYVPPERIFGAKSSYSTDIYALGVILYQMLTLRYPFYRKDIKQYKADFRREKFIDPAKKAPYRDIPPRLSKIAKKCLARHPDKRYKRVEDLLLDLNNYIEGHAEWIPSASIQIEHKDDWRFQENILMAKNIALTQRSDVMEWVSLMIAKRGFAGNMKLETHVHIGEESEGIGFLVNLKPIEERSDFFQDGLLLWIGSESNPGCRLFRSNIELLSNPNIFLQKQLSHFIRIEKTDYHVRLYVDNLLAFDYLSYTPSQGPYFGVVLKDDNLTIGAILVSSSSPNIQVNCLAVPDAFLALGQFKAALSKYRQIASSFSGRPEGREALFRAGLTLLEAGKASKEKRKRTSLFDEALEEFDLLRYPPGSPLELLGKSLVYKTTQNLEDELKCLELALRKFAKHPLIHLVKDQLLFRVHEASSKDRTAAYELTLLALRLIPEVFANKPDHKKFLEQFEKSCEQVPFMKEDVLTVIAFWLCKPSVITDIFQTSPSLTQKSNALYCLLYLGFEKEAFALLGAHPELSCQTDFFLLFEAKEHGLAKTLEKHFLEEEPNKRIFLPEEERALIYLLHKPCFLSSQERKFLLTFFSSFASIPKSLETIWIEILLYEGEVEKAKILMDHDEPEDSPRYWLKGCILLSELGPSKVKEIFYRTFTLSSSLYFIDYFLSCSTKHRQKWLKNSFPWERIQLLSQLCLVYKSSNQIGRYKNTKHALRKELSKTNHSIPQKILITDC